MRNASQLSGNMGTTSKPILERRARVYALIVNRSDTVQYIAFDRPADATIGIPLVANGGNYEINATNPFTGVVWGYCSVSKSYVSVEW